MPGPLVKYAVLVDGRAIPMLVVAGPGGTGKSTLAVSIASLITRAEGGPNVLLVDGDLYSRGLTAEFERQTQLYCKHLHDVFAGRNFDQVEPDNLSARSLLSEGWRPEVKQLVQQLNLSMPSLLSTEWQRLSGEGCVYFLPSMRPEASGCWETLNKLDVSALAHLFHNTLTSAASACRAKYIIADTCAITECLAAVLVSVADLLILVGNKTKTDAALELCRRRLRTKNLIASRFHEVLGTAW